MAISFDGPNRIITLSTGTTSLSVRGLYSRWKEWLLIGDNSKYFPPFVTVGGDDIDPGAGTAIPFYAFLINGWRIRPYEGNHTLNVSDGVLLVEGGGDPFLNTLSAYTVRINYQQPVQAITVATGGGGGGGLTQQQVRDAMTLPTGNPPQDGSIDAEITKIQQNTGLIPALL
jgi:hypothetical protein